MGRLERAGLVERIKSPEDGRGVVCAMTERGWELLSRHGARPTCAASASTWSTWPTPTTSPRSGRVIDAVADNLMAAHPEMEIRPEH